MTSLTVLGDPQSGCIPQGPPSSSLLSSSLTTLQGAGQWALGEGWGDPGEGVWTGESAENLQIRGLGDLPGTLSLMAAFSSFPDELPYLKGPLHTVLKLTPVAFVTASHSSMKRHVPTVCTTGSWELPRSRVPATSCMIHHTRAGVPGILHSSPQHLKPCTWKQTYRGLHLVQNHRVSIWLSRDPAAREAEMTALGNETESHLKPAFKEGAGEDRASVGGGGGVG